MKLAIREDGTYEATEDPPSPVREVRYRPEKKKKKKKSDLAHNCEAPPTRKYRKKYVAGYEHLRIPQAVRENMLATPQPKRSHLVWVPSKIYFENGKELHSWKQIPVAVAHQMKIPYFDASTDYVPSVSYAIELLRRMSKEDRDAVVRGLIHYDLMGEVECEG